MHRPQPNRLHDDLDALLDGRPFELTDELVPLVEVADALLVELATYELDPEVADRHLARVLDRSATVVALPARGYLNGWRRRMAAVVVAAGDCAAALASLMQGTTPLLLTQKEEAPKAPPAIDGSVPTSTYRINVGHAHGVLPGNIVGAIANEAGIDGKRIGHIDIREHIETAALRARQSRCAGQCAAVRQIGRGWRDRTAVASRACASGSPRSSGRCPRR